ncbi:UvrD-like helicase, ATP-binding domain, P-loop containing nucleoside triphosphate hydrolase [Tanacetum coccineum]|uniref:UvrD-like helicase, ATP-binding domain, P-loop containing nucleoside triphosphate hydrolase n=1 Tax=Tanacetum coccineum TaxID=301880 RepID=A0ABQ5DZV8_9ASTR
MKSERGEFDLGDLVNDIHLRLKNGIYEGYQMDLVYIDEVQDLIDKLELEVSFIFGEAPVLLESGDDENAIVTIFGGSGSGSGEDIVGFGAEQVILVRDVQAKIEVCEFVRKNALVLTIVECKGLEFHRVGDTMWEKLSKAYGLRTSAYQIWGTNHEAFEGYLREAALMFKSIGKLKLSTTCY